MGKIQVLGGASTRIKSTVRVWTGKEWAPMEMEVDTGASVSTLHCSDVNALQIFLPLEPAGQPLLNYDQSALQGVRGTISTRVQFGGREAEGELHVVSDRCSSILGRDFLQGLRIVVDCGEGQVQLVGQSGTLKHPGEGVGELVDQFSVHHLLLQPTDDLGLEDDVADVEHQFGQDQPGLLLPRRRPPATQSPKKTPSSWAGEGRGTPTRRGEGRGGVPQPGGARGEAGYLKVSGASVRVMFTGTLGGRNFLALARHRLG